MEAAVSREASGSQQLFYALDPISLLLSQNCGDSSLVMERGPRYRAYAHLRESRLRLKISRYQYEPTQSSPGPPLKPRKKHVKFSPEVAQSVPDFSATLRKENRKPPEMKKNVFPRCSKSASPGEKKMAARKSCAALDELKSMSLAAASAIHAQPQHARIARAPKSNTLLSSYRL